MRKKVNFLAIFAAAMLCAVIAIPTKSHNSIQQALTDTIGVTTVQAEGTDIASGTWGTCPWTIDANGVLTIGAGTGADSYFTISPWDSYKEQITAVKESGAVVLPSKSFGLFRRLKNAKTIDVSGIDTKNVTDMDYMFSECSSLAELDLSSFDTQNVTTMRRMFVDCSSLAELDLSSFNTQNVTGMDYMFSGCSSLVKLNLTSFNTRQVTDMSNMFDDCSSLAELDLSSFNTQNVTNMGDMFRNCKSLTELNLSSFNTQKVTDMRFMFSGCSSLAKLNLTSFNTRQVTDMSGMFSDCSLLAELDLSSFNTQNVTNMCEMFQNCKALTELNLSSLFNTQKVTDMYFMFYGCSSLAELDLSSFNTQNVADMREMFSGCSSLAKLNLSSFDTQNITNMCKMFQNCKALTELNLSSFNTQKVTDMSSMFDDCSSLTELNLSSFNTQKVTDMRSMFDDCSSLRELNLSSWNTQNVRYMDYIFDGCNNLRKLAFGENFKIPAFTNNNQMHLTYPMATESDVISDGKWGLDSETASISYTSDELMSLGKTLGAIKGEWYAQKAPDGTTLSYSVLDSNGTLFFIRSADIVQDSGQGIVKSIDGDSYTGVIYPNIENANFSQSPLPGNSADQSAIKAVKIIDEIHPTSTRDMFSGLENCVSMDLAKLDTSGVMDMSYMFSGCSSLAELDLSSFNTQNVTNMRGMFSDCSSLQSVNVGSFDTSKVQNMESMFNGCKALWEIDLSSFDTQSVWDMNGLLVDCTNLRKMTFGPNFVIPGSSSSGGGGGIVRSYKLSAISSGGTSKASIFTTPILTVSDVESNGEWGLGSEENGSPAYTATNLATIGHTAGALNGVWYAQGKSTDASEAYAVIDGNGNMYFIRSTAAVTTGVPNTTVTSISGGTYTGTVYGNIESDDSSVSVPDWLLDSDGHAMDARTDVKHVQFVDDIHPDSTSKWFAGFTDCESMDLAKLDTVNVGNMSGMFYNCSSLAELNVSGFDTHVVTNMYKMFYGCAKLKEIDISAFDTESVKVLGGMLADCTNLRKMTLGEKFVIPNNSSSHYGGGGGYESLEKIRAVMPVMTGPSGPEADDNSGVFTKPRLTISDAPSIGTWGLGAEENGSPAYTAQELQTAGKTLGALTGTWYAQKLSDGASLAYAVIGDDGVMTFLRSTEVVDTETPGTTVTSISGGTYTGTVYDGLENQDAQTNPTHLPAWQSHDRLNEGFPDIKRVQFVDDIHPYNTTYWFGGFTGCESMNLAKLDVSNVKYMSGMFYYCSSLTSLDLSSFDTRNVTDMSMMLSGCDNLAKITFGSTFVVPSSMSGEGLDSIFPTPAKTISGAESTGSWGFGAVKSTSSILAASELATTGETEGALTGTWYAQRKPFVIVLGKYGEQPDVDGNVATVTVNNLKDGSTVKLYQVVDGYYENDKLVRYVLTDPDNGVIAAIGDSTKGQTEGQNDIITEDELTMIANNIRSGAFAYSDDGIDMTVSGTSATADVEPGMYIVIATDPSGEMVYNPAVVAVNIADVNNGTIEGGTVDMSTFFQHADGSDTTVAYLKASKSDADVEISGSSKAGSTDVITPKSAYGDVVAAGDTVHFTLNQMTIPSFSETYTAPQYIITSTPDDSFDAYTNLKVSVGGTDITGDTSKYTVEANGKGFKINFASDYLSSLRGTENTARDVVVTYDAVLSNPSANFAENHTRTTVQYSNDPTDTAALSTITKDAYHYTLGIDTSIDSEGNGKVANTFIKVKPDGSVGTDGTITNALSGAVFTLYSDEGCTSVMKTAAQPDGTTVSDENGRIVFSGLDEGTYYLKETKAPLGYGLSDQTFRFTLTTELNTSGAMTKYTITKAYKDALHSDWTDAGTDTYTAQASDDGTTQGIVTADDGSITYNIVSTEAPTVIVNSRLQIMPETGGHGVKLMVLVAVLAGISGYAVRRKHEAE